MNKEKTIREWFLMLKEPYRRQALMNTPTKSLDSMCDSLVGALIFAFDWDTSPEKLSYWEAVHDDIENYIKETPRHFLRMVEVRDNDYDDWEERELLADLRMVDPNIKHPYVCRGNYYPIPWRFMREIKESQSFGEFATLRNYNTKTVEGLNFAYEKYHKYLIAMES